MALSDLCRENLVTIEPNATLLDAARLMAEKHIGDLVVVSHSNGAVKPVGMITDRDITLAATDDQPLSVKFVEAVMSQAVQVLSGKAGVAEATRLMREKSIRRIPIVGDEGQMIGILTTDDLYQLLSQEFSDLAAICDLQVAREKMPKSMVRHGAKVEAMPKASKAVRK